MPIRACLAKEGNSSYFNRDTWASCVTGVEEFERDFIVPNHVVTIVGWDDAYSKDNYTEGCRPAVTARGSPRTAGEGDVGLAR